MADLVAELQASVAGFFPAMLGIRFLTAARDRVTAELMVRDEFCTVPGIMHGGAVMAFADTLGGAATSLNLPPEHGTTTIESKTNFFAPGVPGKKVLGECAALHRGKRTLVWQTKVTNEEGRLLALVTQTQMVLEPRRSPQQVMAGLFEGLDAGGQEALLARLERGGAQVYRQLAETERDDGRRAALLAAAGREEENAALLEKQPT